MIMTEQQDQKLIHEQQREISRLQEKLTETERHLYRANEAATEAAVENGELREHLRDVERGLAEWRHIAMEGQEYDKIGAYIKMFSAAIATGHPVETAESIAHAGMAQCQGIMDNMKAEAKDAIAKR